jgi:hypothetical protein
MRDKGVTNMQPCWSAPVVQECFAEVAIWKQEPYEVHVAVVHDPSPWPGRVAWAARA